MRRYPSTVENYTNPFLVVSALILFMGFFTIAAIKGFIWVVLSATILDAVIRAGEARLRASEAREDG